MKKFVVLMITVAACTSCDLFKKPILMEEVINEKIQIDAADNPAKKYIKKEDLASRRITLFDVTVKDVTASNNIEYDYCVKADVQTKKGMVECNIYSADVKTVAKLVKGKSRIDVAGVFGRFSPVLDDYFSRVDIIRACITIK
jgi:hypothetical protein